MIPADVLPWLVPGILATLAVSLLFGGVIGRWLGTRTSVAWLLLMSVGVILSATLSPLDGGSVVPPGAQPTCDLSRTGLPSLAELRYGQDVALNVVMLVPLGVAIGLAPRSARKLLVLLSAIALPPTIETIQLHASGLGRACQGADIVDNLLGLAIGLVLGALVQWLLPALRRPTNLGS